MGPLHVALHLPGRRRLHAAQLVHPPAGARGLRGALRRDDRPPLLVDAARLVPQLHLEPRGDGGGVRRPPVPPLGVLPRLVHHRRGPGLRHLLPDREQQEPVRLPARPLGRGRRLDQRRRHRLGHLPPGCVGGARGHAPDRPGLRPHRQPDRQGQGQGQRPHARQARPHARQVGRAPPRRDAQARVSASLARREGVRRGWRCGGSRDGSVGAPVGPRRW
mmetsp:Transcript_25295/g.88265  ORF Transcript_25295/g.88265 Transcript_25295/m.88265 type:complete len:219 (+) Transcript_25295:1038-1694(+)